MPRPTKTVETIAEVQAEETETVEAPAPARKRERNPNVGLFEAPTKATPPVTARGGRGRSVDAATLEVIERLTADTGEWYLIGAYSNATPPKGVWESSDIVFQHASREDGLFDRYAKHDPDEAAAKRVERERRAAAKAAQGNAKTTESTDEG